VTLPDIYRTKHNCCHLYGAFQTPGRSLLGLLVSEIPAEQLLLLKTTGTITAVSDTLEYMLRPATNPAEIFH
jgi:hypothetical protein